MAVQAEYPHAGLYNFFDEEATGSGIRFRFWTDSVGDGTGVPDTVLPSLTLTGQGVSWVAPAADTDKTVAGGPDGTPTTPEFQNNPGLAEPVTIWWMTIEYDYDGDGTYEIVDTAKHDSGGFDIKTNQKFEVGSGTGFTQGEPSSDTLQPDETTGPGGGTPDHPNDALTGIIHDAIINEDNDIQGFDTLRIIYVVDDGTSNGYRKNKDILISNITSALSIDSRGMLTLSGGTSTEVTFDSGVADGFRLEDCLLALYNSATGTQRIFAAAKDVKDTDGDNIFINEPHDIQLNTFDWII